MNVLCRETKPALLGFAILLFSLLSHQTSEAQSLPSIDVIPANPTISVGQTQPFTATGTFSDSSSRVLSPASTVAAGQYHTCALLSDGTVQCWGGNGSGQLGNGTTMPSLTPVSVFGISDATAVAAGQTHTCAVLSDGTVQCWGSNLYGQLGNGGTPVTDCGGFCSATPVSVSGISTATAIVTGSEHTCALLSDGTVKCWGDNSSGQLGNGTTVGPGCGGICSATPVAVSGISTATAVSAGYSHTCALLSNSTVECWGYNHYGQLGNGSTTDSSAPVSVFGISTATAVAAGSWHTCVLLSDGTVQCWGYNVFGQLGNGTNTGPQDCDGEPCSTVPVPVSGITTATAVSTGYLHTCAVLTDGTVQCWGYNASGQLGDGTSLNIAVTPVSVLGISTATAVSTGTQHTCALLSDGTVQCWGANSSGQLGNGSTTDSSSPVSVIGIFTSTAVAAGGNNTCALLSDGTVKCWGDNFYGQLGNGTTMPSLTPVSVFGISTATAVAAGGNNTCAVLSDGTVQCWGYNYDGELGIGTNIGPESCNGFACSTTPVSVFGISTATAVTVGSDHSCAALSDGTVKCWGNNGSGELGDGTGPNFSPYPVSVIGISTATAVAAGGQHTCALLSDGTVKCWGGNGSGQLGDGTGSNFSTPVSVFGISTATAVAAGLYHTCAVLSDGTVKCWGFNLYGQLGDGTSGIFANAVTPVSVFGISTATAVAAGEKHTCALLSDGTVECWGSGQLGDGSPTEASFTPVSVFGISTATAVAAGTHHTCALLSDGAVKCWGGYFSPTPETVSGTVIAVVWTSSDTGVATINANGVAAGLSPGTTTITATSGSVSGSTTLTVVPTQPDLFMTNVSPGSASVNQGGTLSVTDTVSNSGTASTAFRIAYHLSGNTTYGDGDDVVLSTIRVVRSLGAGASNTATTSLAIPSNAPGGTYYLCAKADSLNQVNEGGNEGNNTLCSGVTVTLPKADLIVSALSATPTTVKAGRTITVSNSIKNQGGAKAGSSVVAFHLSIDAAYGGGDDVVSTTTRTIASLAINATSTASTVVRVPATTPPGDYYVCIQADKNNKVAESDEGNNTRCTGGTITVTP